MGTEVFKTEFKPFSGSVVTLVPFSEYQECIQLQTRDLNITSLYLNNPFGPACSLLLHIAVVGIFCQEREQLHNVLRGIKALNCAAASPNLL